jgi:anaerobic ribonucleoside-triphosphate reductase
MLKELKEKTKSLPKVRSHDEMVPFEIEDIINSLILETKMSTEMAVDITNKVVNKLLSANMKYLTGGFVRELCNTIMAEEGLEKERIKYTRIGLPIHDITRIISDPTVLNSNANLLRNPETISKIIHDEVMESYTLHRMPKKLGDAHLKGDVYIKDRDYFYTRDYCASWDPRHFLVQGLAPDGLGGRHSSYAKPAKHALVAMNHAAIWLAAAQSNFAGGQGYFYFNAFLAPYMRGLSKKEIKQCAQHFVFIMTQQYVARGGQIIFSSIDLTPGIPKILEDVPAVKPKGIVGPETYGEYKEECQKLFDAFIDVFLEGDGKGKLFNYPKPNLILREEFVTKEFESSWLRAAELTIKYGLPYFENYLNWRKDIAAGCSSCCSHLWVAETEEELESFKGGSMIFGASQMVTPNFPRAAWIAKQYHGGEEKAFFNKISEYLEICKEVFIEKKQAVEDTMTNGNAPFYGQKKINGEPLISSKDRMFLVGTVGMNEVCEILFDKPLHDVQSQMFIIKLLSWLKKECKSMSNEIGLSVDITRTPAESAAGRLAAKDSKAFPGIRRYLKGTLDLPYYTNSTAISVDADISLSDRIIIEGKFHPFMSGGALTHIYLGDIGKIEPEAVWKLILHIARNTMNSYFCFTRDLLVCECGYSGAMGTTVEITANSKGICPQCGGEAEIYSRITGYLQSLSNFNKTKRQEFVDRKRYDFRF